MKKRPNQFGNKPDVSYQTKRNLYDLMQEIALFYQSQLPLNIPAQSYLQQRGLSPDIIDRFQIGYVPQCDGYGVASIRQKSRRTEKTV